MDLISRLREWYEHERDSNAKTLAMIESVPRARRSDTSFARAVQLAAHLAACRENWLDRMIGDGTKQVDWWPESTALDTLRPRYAELESAWKSYIDSLSDEDLTEEFEFPTSDGSRWRWSIEGQIIQLVGHAFYHRGQIAMLVQDLGGETVDTDYLFWAYPRNRRYGKIA